MSEKQFELSFNEEKINDILSIKKKQYNKYEVVDLLNTQAEEISYWKHKVSSLLWILGQFDKEKVKALMEELEEDNSGDDGVFNFNSNCAKLYQIRSVSPNGVIRLGKKNYKAKWRMKDVKEINNELPTREEFNRETYQRLRNKYHTKHWCGDDVLGRIIYNIYEGTFGDYL